jgi:hypothetical protein
MRGNACLTASRYGPVNVAPTIDCPVPIVTEQVRVPVQAPVHPVKVSPVPGVAVSVTTVAVSYGAEHAPVVVVQSLMPAGVLVTEPEFEVVAFTVTVKTGGSVQPLAPVGGV